MERKNLSNTLKHHSIVSKATNNIIHSSSSNFANNDSNNKLKYPWTYSNASYGEDYLGGFSWPPRSYTCSFCKREFRSAQALGGHMNVHRRDRARLRQSPPRDNPHCHLLNLNTNPNPNPSLNPSATSPALCTTALFNGSSSTKAANFDITRNLRTRKSFFDGNEEVQDGQKLLKKAENLRLDLEIGLSNNHSKDDLDLELRLGYS